VFTGLEGQFVALKDALEGFRAVMDGEMDEFPEQAFYMIGGPEMISKKAAQIAEQEQRMAKLAAERESNKEKKKKLLLPNKSLF